MTALDVDTTAVTPASSPGAPHPKALSTRVTLVFFAVFQITMAAGLVVGWAGISGNLLREQAHLTLDESTQLYGLAASVNYMSPIVLGLILDKCGPRTCSAVSNAIVAVGCALFACAETLTQYAVGLSLIAFGGPGVQTSLMHTGNLFPARRFFVMGCVAESITLSFAVLPVMDVIGETTGWSFRSLFGTLAGLVALSAVTSMLVWPDEPYQLVEKAEGELAESTKDVVAPNESGSLLHGTNKPKPIVKTSPPKYLHGETFATQVSSGVFLRLTLFFAITSWWANWYIDTITTEFGDEGRFTPDEQHALTEWLSFLDAGAILCAPWSGFMLDSVGFVATAVLTLSLGSLQMILLLVAGDSMSIMVASFVVYACFRSFLFPYFFSSLNRKMGFTYFGVLSGISFGVSGLSQLTLAPVSTLVKGTCHGTIDPLPGVNCSHGYWDLMHAVQLGTLVVMGLIPWFDDRADKKEREEALELADTTHTAIVF